MAINKAFVAAQIRRFAEYPQFPGPAGQAELMTAYRATCDSDETVQQITDYLVRTLEFPPRPSHIYRAAEALAETKRYDENPSPYKPVCARCGGAGFATAYELVTWDQNRTARITERISRERWQQGSEDSTQHVQEIAIACPACSASRARKAAS